MTFKEKVKEIIFNHEKTSFSAKQLYDLFGVNNKTLGEEIIKAMDSICDDGEMTFDPKSKKYKKFDDNFFVIGKLQGHARGFAFCIDEKGVSKDLFVSRAHLHGALHQDRVLVKKLPNTRDEGEVVKILQRGVTQLVGTCDKKHSCFVVPDDDKFFKDVFVPNHKTMGAKHGQKVLVKITDYPQGARNPEGEIISVIGYLNQKGNDILSVALQHGINPDFPESVKQSAKNVPQTVEPKKHKNRRDFTDMTVFTIDGADARDLDDAVSIAQNDDGTVTLGVHIADVSHYVKQGSAIDKEAFERGTSVYFPDKVFPMLPVELSNGICSLNPKEYRLTMSCLMTIDKKGRVIDSDICEGIIKTVERMTYDDVTAIIEGDEQACAKYAHIKNDVLAMSKLAQLLVDKRQKQGAINFETKEVKFVMDEKGRVQDIVPYERTISHKMIEQFMILANETVAQFVYHMELPFAYRVHEKPDAEKLNDLNGFLKTFGLYINESLDDIHSSSLQKIMQQAEGMPYEHIVGRVMLRSMQKAKYHHENLGHFGLASDCYCHFTSPIRRYPDLVVHRVLKLILHGSMDDYTINRMSGFVQEACVQSSEREKIADEAERDADDMKKAEYAQKLVGMEFDGIISGVTSFGIFVELPNTVEGLIRIEYLPEDIYEYDQKNYALIGKNYKFTLSQQVKIKVVGADVMSRKIDFDLVDMI